MTDSNDQKEPSAEQDYAVGYGRPPKATRFKPGQSGNPKGRKRKPKSVQAQMLSALSKKINITEGGRTRRLTLQEVMLRSIANKAAKGDLRAASFVLGLINSEVAAQSDTIDEAKLSAEDQALFEQMLTELTTQEDTPGPKTETESEPETHRAIPTEQENLTDDT